MNAASYDALLAAGAAGEAAARLVGRRLLGLGPLFGKDLLLWFGPRRETVSAVLATEPAAAFYAVPEQWSRAVADAGSPFAPAQGLEHFIRLLEVRLVGRSVSAVTAVRWERTVTLLFGPRQGLDAGPDSVALVHEAAPRPARFVLVGPDDKVVASWPAPGGGPDVEGTARPRAGEPYRPPSRSGRSGTISPLDPTDLALDPNAFNAALAAAERREQTAGRQAESWRLILAAAPALGPSAARAVAERALETEQSHPAAGLSEVPGTASLYRAFREVVRLYPSGPFQPGLLVSRADGSALVTGVTAVSLSSPATLSESQPPESRFLPLPTVGQALCLWHVWTKATALREGLAGQLDKAVRAALARTRRKVERQKADLARAGEAVELRRSGELLLANLHLVKPGQTEVTLPDYDGRPRVIPLDPRLGPSQNAQRYFQRYRKARRAAELDAPRRKASWELAWLKALAYDLGETLRRQPHEPGPPVGPPEGAPEAAEIDGLWRDVQETLTTVRRLQDIGAALQQFAAGSEPARSTSSPGGKKQQPPAPPPGAADRAPGPARFITDDGLAVLAGRSALENETLSLRTAAGTDLWFHVRGYPGSHVVLRVPPGTSSEAVPATSILQAAALAARLSAARGEGKVAVDYTEARHLRRPKGAPPGLVLYDPHRTVVVDTSRVPLPRPVGRMAGASEE